MPDTDQDSGSLWSKIKDIVPYVASAGIGGALGGPAGAVAALGGTGQAEFKAEELRQQRDARMSDVLLQVQQRREAMKQREQDLQERELDRQQQNQFMNTMRTRAEQDRKTWQATQLKEDQLRDQDRHESILDREEGRTEHREDVLESRREHEQDVKLARDNLEAWRNSTGADRTRRTDAYVGRSDAQIKRMDLLNSALVGEQKDYDAYVKTLPDNLQKEAAAFGHTPQARTAFMKEMQKREQGEDPVRRDALIGHAASLLGKDPDDLKTEWAGYSGKKIADLTGNLDLYKAKNGTVGSDGLTKAQKAVATQEGAVAKDIRAQMDSYEKQGFLKKLMPGTPSEVEWVMRRLGTSSTFAQTPEQQARMRRAVSATINEKVPLKDAVKMVYGDIALPDKTDGATSAAKGGGMPEGALRATKHPDGDFTDASGKAFTVKGGYLYPGEGGPSAASGGGGL